MPSISLFDNWGTGHHINSGNPQTIAAWLVERLAMCSDGTAATAVLRMEVYPEYIKEQPDWPPASNLRSMRMEQDDIEVLSLVLEWIAAGRPADHQKLAVLFQALSRRVGEDIGFTRMPS